MRRLQGIGACLALLVALAGCGYRAFEPGAAPPVPVPPSPAVTITHGKPYDLEMEQPPPFRIRYDDTELHLHPVTFCYVGGCVDGWDENPPSVGSPEVLYVFVPVRRFDELTVSQFENGDRCMGRQVAADVKSLGEGWWSVHPRGPAGEYRVSIFASGGGDMVADVLWRTPYAGPLPYPSARLAVIAEHDGRPDSYGVELTVTHLPATPTEYSATITVTAGNGRSITFDAIPSPDACLGAGAISFNGPHDQARQAAALGDFPFTIKVQLTLDGTAYVGTATYPDDEIDDHGPYVALDFDPPLPR